MIDCPKCGFNQPIDRYCANCGVDISNYQPPKEPLVTKLISNPKLYILLSIFVVGGSILFLKQNPEHNPLINSLPQNVKNIEGFANTQQRQETQTENNDDEDFEQGQEELALQATADVEDKTASPVTEKAQSLNTVTLPTKLKITFAEISRDYLTQLVNDGEMINDDGKMQAFKLSDKDKKKIHFNSGIIPLSGGRSFLLKNETVTEVNFVYLDENKGQEFGLSLATNIRNVSEQNFTVEYLGFANFQGTENTPPYSSNFSGQGTIKLKDGVLALVGLLPHIKLSEQDLSQLQNSPINIMNSEEFRSNLSEFIIFFEAQ